MDVVGESAVVSPNKEDDDDDEEEKEEEEEESVWWELSRDWKPAEQQAGMTQSKSERRKLVRRNAPASLRLMQSTEVGVSIICILPPIIGPLSLPKSIIVLMD